MGVYDTVCFTCPNCKATIEVQSKAGECHLSTFGQNVVPVAIAHDIYNQVAYCDNCARKFHILINLEQSASIPMKLSPDMEPPV